MVLVRVTTRTDSGWMIIYVYKGFGYRVLKVSSYILMRED
jgi:hypothetical protein